MRAIFAILIALSLTLAPVNSAWAAMQMRASMDNSTTAWSAGDAEMSDCMKAMQAQGLAPDQSCLCCDAPMKSACPDMGACLAKCSVHVIAVLAPGTGATLPPIRHLRPADPQKPPDWAFAPPAPPPRA